MRHSLQMKRVDAGPQTAKVVDLQAGRNGAHPMFVGDPVSPAGRTASPPEQSISILVLASRPDDAVACVIGQGLGMEPLKGLPVHARDATQRVSRGRRIGARESVRCLGCRTGNLGGDRRGRLLGRGHRLGHRGGRRDGCGGGSVRRPGLGGYDSAHSEVGLDRAEQVQLGVVLFLRKIGDLLRQVQEKRD
jgi:hypothetical protein